MAGALAGRSHALLAVGLLLFALLFVWLGVAAPLLGWYRTRAGLLAERRSVAQHMEALAASLPSLRAEALHARTAMPQATLIGGDSDALAAALLQSRMEELAQRVNARLTSIGILSAEPAGNWRRIGLRIAVNAPYSVIVRLLQSLLTTTPAMAIDDLSLLGIAISTPGHPGIMNVEFTVYAFRRVAPASCRQACNSP